VTGIEHFQFLGLTITNTLKWDNNISQLVKKDQPERFTAVPLEWYNSTERSFLTVWFASASARAKARLQRVIRAAERIIGCPLPSIMDLHSSRSITKAAKIVADPSHPVNSLFHLLPSGKRYRAILFKTSHHLYSFFSLSNSPPK